MRRFRVVLVEHFADHQFTYYWKLSGNNLIDLDLEVTPITPGRIFKNLKSCFEKCYLNISIVFTCMYVKRKKPLLKMVFFRGEHLKWPMCSSVPYPGPDDDSWSTNFAQSDPIRIVLGRFNPKNFQSNRDDPDPGSKPISKLEVWTNLELAHHIFNFQKNTNIIWGYKIEKFNNEKC